MVKATASNPDNGKHASRRGIITYKAISKLHLFILLLLYKAEFS